MTTRDSWSRRSAVAGLTAGLWPAAPRARAAAEPAPAPAPGPATPQTPAQTDGGAVLETAFDQALRVTVPVYLNGKGPFDFVIDTGANSSVVSVEVAASCALPDAGAATLHGIIGAQSAPLARVAQVRVGGVTSHNLQLPVLSASRIGAAGILGLDMFRGRRIELDFRRSSFEVAPTGSGIHYDRGNGSRVRSPSDAVTVPARFRSGQLIILDAEAMGRPITAFLDSGSQVTVANRALRDTIFNLRPDLAAGVIHSQLISATGQKAPAEFAPLPGLRLGGQLLDSPFVAYADLHIFDLWDLRGKATILIGVDILRRFDQVAFDFGRKEITFWAHRPTPPSAARPRVGS